ncbi:MAG: hypothetical protein JJE52_14710 [Acidimicrobiia bacterium]|nr:hypothetical protein [Acidimicrobiia bacterium]
MRNWSPIQLGLVALALVVFVAVAALGLVALSGADVTCVEGEQAVIAPVDRPAEEALGEFVANNSDQYPLGGWEVDEVDGDVTTFVNDDGGDHEVVVESGVVRSFSRCEG